MWFGLILACSVDSFAECKTLSGNIVLTEEACEETFDEGYRHVKKTMPGYEVIAFRCETWGEPA